MIQRLVATGPNSFKSFGISPSFCWEGLRCRHAAQAMMSAISIPIPMKTRVRMYGISIDAVNPYSIVASVQRCPKKVSIKLQDRKVNVSHLDLVALFQGAGLVGGKQAAVNLSPVRAAEVSYNDLSAALDRYRAMQPGYARVIDSKGVSRAPPNYGRRAARFEQDVVSSSPRASKA